MPITIRYRGTSSFKYYPKKQYAVSIKDDSYRASGLGLLDFPGGKDFILYAPYGDKSLVRNVLAYNLFRKLGHYAPLTKFVTLALKDASGNTTQMGIYVLIEKIRVATSRLNIGSKGDAPPYSYLLRFDRLKERNFVTTDQNHDVVVDYPKGKQWDDIHKKNLLDYLNAFEKKLFGGAGPVAGAAALDDVDMTSLVDFIIMQELAKNIDAYEYSCFFYLPAGGRLTFGPVWDMDIAYGNVDLFQGWMTDGYQFQQESDTNWFKKLLTHPLVKQALKARWSELRSGALSDATLSAMIDEQVGVLPADVIAENFAIWNILGVKVWPNYTVNPTYALEVAALKIWLKARASWLDSAVPNL